VLALPGFATGRACRCRSIFVVVSCPAIMSNTQSQRALVPVSRSPVLQPAPARSVDFARSAVAVRPTLSLSMQIRRADFFCASSYSAKSSPWWPEIDSRLVQRTHLTTLELSPDLPGQPSISASLLREADGQVGHDIHTTMVLHGREDIVHQVLNESRIFSTTPG